MESSLTREAWAFPAQFSRYSGRIYAVCKGAYTGLKAHTPVCEPVSEVGSGEDIEKREEETAEVEEAETSLAEQS